MTTKIKAGVITADAIETAGIKDANVTTAKLATNAVTAVKITDGTITAAKLATGAIVLPIGYIGGLRLSNDSDASHDVNITAGAARDATNAQDIVLASEITKRIDAAWAVGNDAGGLDGTESVGGTPDASTLYYVWLILRSDTGVEDALFSESATAPTMPTNYDYKRLIGCVKTDGSANIFAFTHRGDYFRYTGTNPVDVNDNTIASLTFEDGTLSCPANCLAHIYGGVANSSESGTAGALYIKTKGASEAAAYPTAWMETNNTSAFDELNREGTCLVDSASEIQYAALEAAGTATVNIVSIGFWMLTRSDP